MYSNLKLRGTNIFELECCFFKELTYAIILQCSTIVFVSTQEKGAKEQ